MTAQKGSKVKVHYVGKFSDGSVFDRSTPDCPLEFTVGEGKVIRGFEQAVQGMRENEQKTITIPSAQAYGERDESLIRRIERSKFPEGLAPQKGMMVKLFLPSGAAVAATIMTVSDQEVVVDMNHPLAGRDLTFDITLVTVQP